MLSHYVLADNAGDGAAGDLAQLDDLGKIRGHELTAAHIHRSDLQALRLGQTGFERAAHSKRRTSRAAAGLKVELGRERRVNDAEVGARVEDELRCPAVQLDFDEMMSSRQFTQRRCGKPEQAESVIHRARLAWTVLDRRGGRGFARRNCEAGQEGCE